MKKYARPLGYILGILLSFLGFQLAFAGAGEPYDYYLPAPDRLLENVNNYHVNQGIEKARQGHVKDARADFEFMLHYFPNHPRALQLLGDLSIQVGNPEDAFKYFEKAIKLYPKYAATHGLYGVFLHKVGRLNDAIAQYEIALKMDPEAPEINYNLGLARFSQKKYKEANQLAQKAYQHGYPLLGLKKHLEEVGAWQTASNTYHEKG